MVLDGRGQIAGDDLARVVIHRQRHHIFGVVRALIAHVAENRHRVRNHRGLQRMLHVVLRHGVAHQPPTLNQLHAADIGKKVMLHLNYSLTIFIGML